MARPSLLIFGAGGHARMVYEAAARQAAYDVSAFAVDDAFVSAAAWHGCPQYALSELLSGDRPLADFFIVAVGDNAARRKRHQSLVQCGYQPATIIHPAAVVASDAVIGGGSVVGAGAVIDSNVRLGEGVIINLLAIVGHDCVVGEFTHISAGAVLGGGSRAGDDCLVGLNATLVPKTSLGNRSTVGAGSVMTRDMPDDSLAVGVPARRRAQKEAA